MKFISRTTMATILIEEMDSAVPRNSDGTSRVPRLGQQGFGQKLAQRKTAGEWQGDARQRDRHRREARFAHQPEIGLHATYAALMDVRQRSAIPHDPADTVEVGAPYQKARWRRRRSTTPAPNRPRHPE